MGQAALNIITMARRIMSLDGFKEKLLDLKIKSFQPKVVFLKDYKNYRVMTASFPSDLKKILRLRHEIFVKDLDRKTNALEIDFDRYDLMGDHIMIIDRQKDLVIGTYRVIASQFSNAFYSENEFEMEDFKYTVGNKLELGRACIHKDYRNGATLHLVWKGLAHYIKLVEARYLFGCSSIWTDDENRLQNTMHQFADENFGEDFEIQPKVRWRFSQDFELKNRLQEGLDENSKLVPPLLGSYLKAGAKIYGQPAYDRDFRCADVFTVLDMRNINSRYYTKYFDE